ncbi:MAG: helix-hairpin-helix domain-containing protein [Salinivirgaceae bacterium]|nr:helix-hairpin-helix domain-containing protein [Salinivirgaceae bacterium]
MKQLLKDYFTFSRKELSGIIVLIILIILFAVLPKIVSHYKEESILDVSSFEKEISEFEYKIAKKEQAKTQKQLFLFDPNTVSKSNLLKLGFSNKQAETLLKYRKAGGEFENESDLKKVYGVSNDMYKELAPYIRITSVKEKTAHLSHNKKDSICQYSRYDTIDNNFVIELNSADTLDLVKLPGIGATFSRRIVSYREFLGGYYSINQLLEVYGISENTLIEIKNNITIDTLQIIQIDINNADFKTLNKHPYINYKQTKGIFKYLNLMVEFKRKDDILNNNLMDSSSYEKIKPYLLIQPKIKEAI